MSLVKKNLQFVTALSEKYEIKYNLIFHYT